MDSALDRRVGRTDIPSNQPNQQPHKRPANPHDKVKDLIGGEDVQRRLRHDQGPASMKRNEHDHEHPEGEWRGRCGREEGGR
jgi:hypothetical protein